MVTVALRRMSRRMGNLCNLREGSDRSGIFSKGLGFADLSLGILSLVIAIPVIQGMSGALLKEQ